MRRIFITLSILLVASVCNSQTFQATVKPGSLANSVIVAVMPSVTVNNAKITTFYFAIAVPATVSPKPSVSILTNFNAALSYTIETPASELVGGTLHYIYNFLSDGSVAAGTERNYIAGADNNLIEVSFADGPQPPAVSTIRLVSLANGGTTANTYFNIYNLGTDVTNTTAMFYGGVPVNSGSGYTGTSYTSLANIALPVKFLGFNVTKKNNDAILNWQIENESSLTDRYEIERSLNGVDFRKFTTVAPKNNGNSGNSYNLADFNLSTIRSAGIFYYRIKQVDKDGNFIYSMIRNLRLNSKGIAISVYPNPIREFANVTIDLEQDTDATVTINDASGKLLQNIQMQLFKGLNIKKINMATFATGSYMLKVQTSTEIKTMTVVKTN